MSFMYYCFNLVTFNDFFNKIINLKNKEKIEFLII